VRICYHGTDAGAAEAILCVGFRPNTHFAANLQDAIGYGGPWVFEVMFDHPPEGWQWVSSVAVSKEKIVSLRNYDVHTVVDHGDRRQRVFDAAPPPQGVRVLDDALSRLADIRGMVLQALGPDHPVHQRWWMEAVSNPRAVVSLVRDWIAALQGQAAPQRWTVEEIDSAVFLELIDKHGYNIPDAGVVSIGVRQRLAGQAAPGPGYNADDPADCYRAAADMVGQAAGLCASAAGALLDADDNRLGPKSLVLRARLNEFKAEIRQAALAVGGGKEGGGDA